MTEWVCTLCEAAFADEDKGTAHMWDQHGSGDPYRMYRWQDGEILELEERDMADVDPFLRAVCATQPYGHYFDFDSSLPRQEGLDWN